jgi:hypothetical protein
MARKVAPITVERALQLIDLIREQVKTAENNQVKKILLTAGIRLADLALAEATARRIKAAA